MLGEVQLYVSWFRVIAVAGAQGMSTREIKQKVKRCRMELEHKYIDPRFGLLAELITAQILSRSYAEKVESKPCTDEQNKQLIKYMLKKPSTESSKFLDALSRNYQQHVVNFILDAIG